MDAMSSLISRRETHDATSDVTKRLAAAVIWHVSVLVDSSENSAITMYNITHLFSMNYHWYSTSWSVSKTPQKPTLSYTPMHDRWDHLPAGYLLGNVGALIVNLRPRSRSSKEGAFGHAGANRWHARGSLTNGLLFSRNGWYPMLLPRWKGRKDHHVDVCTRYRKATRMVSHAFPE